MPSSSPPVLEFVVSVVLLRLVRLFCLGNGRFEAGFTQNFFAGLCPAPRWGWPPQTRPLAAPDPATHLWTHLPVSSDRLSRPQAPHTDRYDIFVLQLWGSKSWKTCVPRLSGDPIETGEGTLGASFKSFIGAYMSSGEQLSDAELAELHELRKRKANGCSDYNDDAIEIEQGVLQCTERAMASGDTLYVPKGVVHIANTAETGPAAHLTISMPMQGLMWSDLLLALVNADALGCALRLAVDNTLSTLLREPWGIVWRRPLPMWLLEPWAREETRQDDTVAINVHDELRRLVDSTGLLDRIVAELPSALEACKRDQAEVVNLASDVTRLLTRALNPDGFSSRLKLHLREQRDHTSDSLGDAGGWCAHAGGRVAHAKDKESSDQPPRDLLPVESDSDSTRRLGEVPSTPLPGRMPREERPATGWLARLHEFAGRSSDVTSDAGSPTPSSPLSFRTSSQSVDNEVHIRRLSQCDYDCSTKSCDASCRGSSCDWESCACDDVYCDHYIIFQGWETSCDRSASCLCDDSSCDYDAACDTDCDTGCADCDWWQDNNRGEARQGVVNKCQRDGRPTAHFCTLYPPPSPPPSPPPPSPSPPPPSPPPPSPPPPFSPITFPPSGVWVLNGDKNDGSGACVTDETHTRDPIGDEPIAAQCCTTDGACRRRASGNGGPVSYSYSSRYPESQFDSWFCILGPWTGVGDSSGTGRRLSHSTRSFEYTTYQEAVRLCWLRGLVLCDQSCKGQIRCAPSCR